MALFTFLSSMRRRIFQSDLCPSTAWTVESLRSYLKSLPEGDVAEAIKYVSGKGGGV
jgi:hypothetical protein